MLVFCLQFSSSHLTWIAVEVADVTDDGVVLHLHEVLAGEDVLTAGGGNEDVAPLHTVLHGGHLVALHGGLQGVDWVHLGDNDPAAESPQGLGAALADVSVAGDHGDLPGQHHVSGALDPVNQRLPAAVQVVELRLGDGVVDVDGGHLQVAELGHLVEVVHAGGGLLGEALDIGQVLRVLLVDEVGEVAAIVEDHVKGLAVGEDEGLLDAPHVLLVGLSLPGVDWDTDSSDGCGGVVLGGEDVARAPCDISAKLKQGLNQDGGLNSHMKTSRNPGSLQRLGRSVGLPEVHESRHLLLSEGDCLSAPVGEGDVGHLVRNLRSHDCGWSQPVSL